LWNRQLNVRLGGTDKGQEYLWTGFFPEYINYASRRNCDPRIEFKVGNSCALPFPDRSFDRVISLLMLHFVPQTDQAVAEMQRVARPHSTVAAAVWDARGGYVANRILFDTAVMLDPAANERRARNYTRPMTRPGELATAWRKAGFENVQEGTLTIRMEFASFSDYWVPYIGMEGPVAAHQQQKLKDCLAAGPTARGGAMSAGSQFEAD